jgi:sugar lactone lactonase YvrE
LDTTGSFNTILYDAIVPSANITVAGNISFTQGFPSGVLGASTQYYLGFYDTTQASPAWQTIAGPVTPSGSNLTFSGTISSLTLAANKVYGFAVFSTVSPTGTPPPTPQTLIYFGNDTTLSIAAESGAIQTTLPIGSNSFDLDDAGNVYAELNPTGSGNASLAMYPAGSASPAATYIPSVAGEGAFISASGNGEVAAVYSRNGNNVLSSGQQTTDVWDPGKTGTPSRTLVTQAGSNLLFAMTHDGTLYLPSSSGTGVPEYDIFPPGAAVPSKVITETIVPASQYANFDPNYAAVGPDGTLYVTEYSFQQPDPNAGVYIYPGNGGAEKFIAAQADANGAGPQGIDVDGSGNIYVVNNNSGIAAGGQTCQGDSLQDVTVYSPSGTLLRTVAGGNSGFPITVAADGTAFFATFQVQFAQSCAATGADDIFSVAPGASTSTNIEQSGSTEIILYDGTHKTSPFYSGGRGATGSSHAGSRGAAFRRHLRR